MPSSFKRGILSQRMKWSRRLLLLGPSPQVLLPIRLLSHPTVMDRLFSLQTPIFSVTTTSTTLPTPSLQDSSEHFSLLFFPIHSTVSSSSISHSSPPSYSDSLSSFASHTFTDKPVFSSSCILTSPLPSSLPPSYPIYRPIPIYTSSRPSSLSVGSIPYLYSSILSTNTLSLSYHGSSSTRVSPASSGPASSGPK